MSPRVAFGITDAESLGYLFGIVISIGIVLAILVFGIIAVVKAFTRRTTIWIVTGSFAVLILAVPVLFVVAGFVRVFTSPSQRFQSKSLTSDTGSFTRAKPADPSPSATIGAGTMSDAKQLSDPASPLRQHAAKMAATLVFCGLSRDEAYEVALHKMPGLTTVNWWRTELLPRFNEEQQRIIVNQLESFQAIERQSGKSAVLAYLYELAIWKILENEKEISRARLFELWQAGVINQSDETWRAGLDGVSATKQGELNRLRDRLKALPEKTISPVPALPENQHHVRLASRTDVIITRLKKLGVNPSNDFRIAVQHVEDAGGRFMIASSAIDPDTVLDSASNKQSVFKKLEGLKGTAQELVAAVDRYKGQSRELLRSNLNLKQQEQAIKENDYGYDHIQAAAASAIKAADAGLALCDQSARGTPSDATQQQFVQSWNDYREAMTTLLKSAQEMQTRFDTLHRDKEN